MSKEETYPQKKMLKPRVWRISLTVGTFCLVAVAASLFSFPFPFVRQMWIREVLGLSGLLHVIAFLLILRQIEKHHSIPALLAGLGLILNEQILSCRGFWIVITEQSANFQNVLYFTVAAIAMLFVALIMISTFEFFCAVRKAADERTPPLFSGPLDSLRLLVPFVFIYALIFTAVFYSIRLWTGPMQFAVLKNIAWIASAVSMAGIGFEINDYIDKVQTKKMCWVKALSHGICLTAILWVIYRLMPVESVIILG